MLNSGLYMRRKSQQVFILILSKDYSTNSSVMILQKDQHLLNFLRINGLIQIAQWDSNWNNIWNKDTKKSPLMMKSKRKFLRLENKCSKIKCKNKILQKIKTLEDHKLKSLVNVYKSLIMSKFNNCLKQKRRLCTFQKILTLYLHSLMIIWMNVLKIQEFVFLNSCKMLNPSILTWDSMANKLSWDLVLRLMKKMCKLLKLEVNCSKKKENRLEFSGKSYQETISGLIKFFQI